MKIEITKELLAQLKEKAEKATLDWLGIGGYEIYFDKPLTRILATQCVVGYAEKDDDAAYIAAANPSVMLTLIARIEELEASNYGPEILNDPQALTVSYFAGRMAEGRENNAEIDKLNAEIDRLKVELHDMDSSAAEAQKEYRAEIAKLEKEADWLARQLTKSEDIPCPEHPCVRTERDGCFSCWRKAARKAVEKKNEAHESAD